MNVKLLGIMKNSMGISRTRYMCIRKTGDDFPEISTVVFIKKRTIFRGGSEISFFHSTTEMFMMI